MIKLTEHLDKISETPVEYQCSTTVLQWIISLGWFYCSWPQNLGWKEVFNGALCSFWGKEFQWDVWFYVGQTLCFFATEQTNTASHRSDCHDTGVCCSVTSVPFYFEIVTSCVGSSPLCDLPHLSSPVSLHLHLIPSSVCLYSLCAPLSCQCYSSASPFDLMVCSSFICSLCFHWFALCFSCYFVLLTHFLLFLHFFFFYRYIYIYISFSFWLMKCFYSSLVIVTRTLTLL